MVRIFFQFCLHITLFVPSLTLNSYNVYEKAPWGYKGEKGPKFWGDLKPEFKKCTIGKVQSPIEIKKIKQNEKSLPLSLRYKTVLISIINDGQTIRVEFPKGSFLKKGAETFKLLNFEIHTPSEHKINGKIHPLEIQFTHKNDRGQYLMVSVMVNEGEFNNTFQMLVNHSPSTKSYPKEVKTLYVNARDFFPESLTYYQYAGSLTKPPCTEDIQWVIIEEPIEAKKEQIDWIHKTLGNNARPLQALNNRQLVKVSG